jgi:glutamate carboxypeptidase
MALTAIQILRELKALSRQVKLLLHSDEEIGSPVSRPVTENVARQCGAVYVLEPAQGRQGAYKTARKGVGHYRLQVSGVAAHSGVDFSAGHSAILELAHQIERISGLTNSGSGVTVNAGVIGGGTRRNVVAANAWAEIDVRTSTMRDAARIDRALRALRVIDKGCKLRVSGGVNRPPMERTKGSAALFRRAQHLASALGFALEEASTGGGSDGNFTAALGIPTLDGTGAVGAGAHAAHEHILAEHLAARTALLAAMMLPSN